VKNIVLTGFMATGKTQIGTALSALLDIPFIDTDAVVVETFQKSINEIFASEGEEGFREKEARAVRKAAQLNGAVIATGGGVPLRKENMDCLRENGIIIYLSPSFETILARLEQASAERPLLKNQDVEEIRARFEARKPYYQNCDYTIPVSNKKTPEEHAREIAQIYQTECTKKA
jgi:shikimate kinase